MRIVYLLTILLLVGCLSPKKAERQLAKINDKYPEKVSGMCADSFVVSKTDTLVTLEYDWIELESDTTTMIDTIAVVHNDVHYKYIHIPAKTITITKYEENTARVKELSIKLDNCDKDRQKAVIKAKTYQGYSKILGLILALLIIVIYFVLKRKQ